MGLIIKVGWSCCLLRTGLVVRFCNADEGLYVVAKNHFTMSPK